MSKSLIIRILSVILLVAMMITLVACNNNSADDSIGESVHAHGPDCNHDATKPTEPIESKPTEPIIQQSIKMGVEYISHVNGKYDVFKFNDSGLVESYQDEELVNAFNVGVNGFSSEFFDLGSMKMRVSHDGNMLIRMSDSGKDLYAWLVESKTMDLKFGATYTYTGDAATISVVIDGNGTMTLYQNGEISDQVSGETVFGNNLICVSGNIIFEIAAEGKVMRMYKLGHESSTIKLTLEE